MNAVKCERDISTESIVRELTIVMEKALLMESEGYYIKHCL